MTNMYSFFGKLMLGENEKTKIRELPQMENIGNMGDIQRLFQKTIAELTENGNIGFRGRTGLQ